MVLFETDINTNLNFGGCALGGTNFLLFINNLFVEINSCGRMLYCCLLFEIGKLCMGRWTFAHSILFCSAIEKNL